MKVIKYSLVTLVQLTALTAALHAGTEGRPSTSLDVADESMILTDHASVDKAPNGTFILRLDEPTAVTEEYTVEEMQPAVAAETEGLQKPASWEEDVLAVYSMDDADEDSSDADDVDDADESDSE